MRHIPPCPMCGNDDVENVSHVDHPGRYLCGRCWTVYSGSPDEWAAHREDREVIARRREQTVKYVKPEGAA